MNSTIALAFVTASALTFVPAATPPAPPYAVKLEVMSFADAWMTILPCCAMIVDGDILTRTSSVTV